MTSWADGGGLTRGVRRFNSAGETGGAVCLAAARIAQQERAEVDTKRRIHSSFALNVLTGETFHLVALSESSDSTGSKTL